MSKTVRAAVDNISQTFREFDHGDPRLNESGQTSRLLLQQFKGYKEEDPDEKQEKAIPFSVIRQMHKRAKDELERAIAFLCTGAMFFCMRSCEYSKVPMQEDRKTKLLCLRNLRFFRNGTVQDHRLEDTHKADLISITFEDQKNRQKNQSINLHRSKDDTLCPVRAWSTTTKRIWSYEGTTKDTPVNCFVFNKKFLRITNSNIIKSLPIESMKDFNLGFESSEVGTHSIRSGGAMALCLAKVDTYMIMIIGRWKSDAFMKYIRKQVEQFTTGITDRMIEVEHFNHVPKDISLRFH